MPEPRDSAPPDADRNPARTPATPIAVWVNGEGACVTVIDQPVEVPGRELHVGACRCSACHTHADLAIRFY